MVDRMQTMPRWHRNIVLCRLFLLYKLRVAGILKACHPLLLLQIQFCINATGQSSAIAISNNNPYDILNLF